MSIRRSRAVLRQYQRLERARLRAWKAVKDSNYEDDEAMNRAREAEDRVVDYEQRLLGERRILVTSQDDIRIFQIAINRLPHRHVRLLVPRNNQELQVITRNANLRSVQVDYP